MRRFCPLLIATASLTLFISACSTPDDLATTLTLEPQFGTRGYDEVTDVAYGQALTLYAVGIWDRSYEFRAESGRYVERQDAFIRRFDRSGNLVWENYLEVESAYANNDDYGGYVPVLSARAVAVDGSGNALVAWSAQYSRYDSSSRRYVVAASFDYLTKYNPSGGKLWRIYINGALIDLATDSGGNVYGISGGALMKYTAGGAQVWTRSQPVSPSGVTVSNTNDVYVVRQDGAVLKYNVNGAQRYLKTGQLDGYNWQGNYSSGEPYKIAAGLSNELYVTATRYNSSSEGCDAGLTSDSFTMRAYKLSSTGTRQWVRNVANGTSVQGQDCSGDYYDALSGLGVAADNKGNVYIAGYQNGDNQDGFVAKYSRAGALSWKKGFGTPKDDAATSVASYDGSEVFVGGVTEGFLVHRQVGGGGDAVMREVNNSGNRVWAR
jgi:hypothetical protein